MASTDLGSTRQSSRIIGPILRWFHPEVTEETIRTVQTVVRKGGHLVEYAILAVLLWTGCRLARSAPPLREWQWREAGWIVLGCAAYAVSDELHQTFVATRQGSPVDVGIDTAGAICGLAMIWVLGRWRKRW